jgi:hypothetical protein
MSKRQKTGGRQKGTPNILTKEIRNLLKQFISNEMDYVMENINQLELKDRVQFLSRLLPYILPKMNPIMHNADEPITFNSFNYDFDFAGTPAIHNENDIEQ